jgi:DNA-binding CsgD family transcriptional regulator
LNLGFVGLLEHCALPHNHLMATSVKDSRVVFARLVHRALDLPSYFEAVDSALQRSIPFDASCWLSLDPGTGLPTSHASRQFGFEHLMGLVANEYLEEDLNKFATLAQAERPVGLLSQATGGKFRDSKRYVDVLAPNGYADGDELRAVFRDGAAAWGAVAIHRRQGLFEEHEAAVVADLAGLIAHGIRRAILRTAATDDRGPEPPGLIVLRDDDSLESVTPAARRWLGEVYDSTVSSVEVPLTVVSVAQHARLAAGGKRDDVASVRHPTRTGGWLRMDAMLLDGRARGRVAVILSVARDPEVASLIARAYGLTEREREVTGLVLNGRSTQEISTVLHVSPYTVQDHLKSIFEKAGVRSRRELVAQLFLQQCAPRLAAGAAPGADGWFPDE